MMWLDGKDGSLILAMKRKKWEKILLSLNGRCGKITYNTRLQIDTYLFTECDIRVEPTKAVKS